MKGKRPISVNRLREQLLADNDHLNGYVRERFESQKAADGCEARWRLLEEVVQAIKRRNSALTPELINAAIARPAKRCVGGDTPDSSGR